MIGSTNLDTTKVRSFLQGIELLRTLDSDMPIQYLAGFLMIALRDEVGNPIEAAELADNLNTTQASISRLVGYLGKVGYRGKPGLDMIAREDDIMDRRKKKLHINQRGRSFLHSLVSVISD